MKSEAFIFNFKQLCEWFSRKPSPEILTIYFDVLEGLSEQEWHKAFKWAIATQQFMPTPKMLFESVRGDVGKKDWEKLLKVSQELNSIRYETNYLQRRKPILEGLSPEIKEFLEDEQIILASLVNKSEAQLESLKKKFLNQASNQITSSLKQLNNHANTFRLPQN
jgi:hypothetical protein